MMKIKVGVMGSADDTLPNGVAASLRETAEALGQSIAARNLVLLTGATTGLPYIVGRAAHNAGALHVGVSPASNAREHGATYKLPTDACHVLIYTGFGLKGRNVVLVRSCDIVIFIGGATGSLNELTIAYDEQRVIGCLTGTGGVADHAASILQTFPKKAEARLFCETDPEKLLASCVGALR
ncbi:MAG: LOG family protein [Pyrinomonadaceae bacterium]|nr:LOG family protein [Pyrinomonadaceae bacterium]